jgi:hypothetical protein
MKRYTRYFLLTLTITRYQYNHCHHKHGMSILIFACFLVGACTVQSFSLDRSASSATLKLKLSGSGSIRLTFPSNHQRQRYTFRLLAEPEVQFLVPDPEARDRNGKDTSDLGQRLGLKNDGCIVNTVRSKKHQLWLDLRETALFPHEALGFLLDQCLKQRFKGSDTQGAILGELIDAILVSPSILDKIVANERSSDSDSDLCDHTLLYVSERTRELVMSTALQQSVPIGTLQFCDPRTMSDLNITESIETIVHQDEWLILEIPRSAQSSDSQSWLLKQVSSLLQLTMSSTQTLSAESFEESSSGLFLPGLGKESASFMLDTSDEAKVGGGGIAVACIDRNMFMNMDAILAEHSRSGGDSDVALTSTSSGLLLFPDATDDDEMNEPVRFSTALLLPLELDMWEAALDMRSIGEG